MKKETFVLLLLLSSLSFVNAQSAAEFDTKTIINKGIEFHDEKKYDEAILEFKKVNKNDSNYVLAAVELVNTYIEDGKDSLALELCNSLLEFPSSYLPGIIAFKANALDNLKRSDEAIKVYEEGMAKYPLNHIYSYEMGILKFRQEKYKEAHDWFVKSLQVNPYNANTHFQLGFLASKQGKIIQAMLAWQFYLVINNSSDRAKAIVAALEKMAQNEYDFGNTIKVTELDNVDDFSEIESLVKSKVALSSKYKSETKLKFNFTKQVQLIMEKLVVEKNDQGFFMNFYAQFFSDLYKSKYLEPYTYSILSGFGNSEVDSWVKKNGSKIEQYSGWAVNYIGKNFCVHESVLNGKKTMAQRFYNNNNKIQSVGNRNEQGENIGYWNYYYANGILRSEGAFKNNKRDGVWKYYKVNGVVNGTENYIDGLVEGIVESYYVNGSISSKRTYSKSLLDGPQISYYATGAKKMDYNYKADIQVGKEIKYHVNGKVDYTIGINEGKYNGELIQNHINGNIKQKGTFKDGNRMGKFFEYYDVPANQIKIESNYEKGELNGEFKSYHRNGGVEEVGQYKDGLKHGNWMSYNAEKVLVGEESFNNGKNTGSTKYYNADGKLTEEYIYKNDLLQEYKAYALDGNIVYQNKKEGKNNYDVTLYYPNGNKKREGKVKEGKVEGLWKYYGVNGNLTSESNFADGKREGKTVGYHENGKVKYETNYEKGEANGYYKKFYKNGNLQKEGAYINDTQVGVWKEYFSNGTISSINFYKDGDYDHWQQYFASNGKLTAEDYIELDYVNKRWDYDSTGKVTQQAELDRGNGMLLVNYPDGKPYFKVKYDNNLKQGPFISYYPNGKIASEKNYIDNKLEGIVKYYFPNGNIRTEENYVGGYKHGKTTAYHENGNVKSVSTFEYDEENGKTLYYYANKQLQTEYTYKHDELNGKSTYYSENGDLIMIKNFDENILISYQYNDKTGNLVPPIAVKNETGLIKAYYKSGNVSTEYTLKNGMLEGKKVTYFSDGKVAEESNNVCDDKVGTRKVYYPSGKIKLVENYANDQKNGECISYHENGKIKKAEHFINDDRYGQIVEYDETGKVVNTAYYYNDILIK
jgi:antitoxin component YwqK of YwqJK toxin-antitoxin module